jgi:hypothetical protein
MADAHPARRVQVADAPRAGERRERRVSADLQEAREQCGGRVALRVRAPTAAAGRNARRGHDSRPKLSNQPSALFFACLGAILPLADALLSVSRQITRCGVGYRCKYAVLSTRRGVVSAAALSFHRPRVHAWKEDHWAQPRILQGLLLAAAVGTSTWLFLYAMNPEAITDPPDRVLGAAVSTGTLQR